VAAGTQSKQHFSATGCHFMSKESQIIFLHLRAVEGPDNAGNTLPFEPPPPSLWSASCDPTVATQPSQEGSVSVRRDGLSSTCTGLGLPLCSHPDRLQSQLQWEGKTQVYKLCPCGHVRRVPVY